MLIVHAQWWHVNLAQSEKKRGDGIFFLLCSVSLSKKFVQRVYPDSKKNGSAVKHFMKLLKHVRCLRQETGGQRSMPVTHEPRQLHSFIHLSEGSQERLAAQTDPLGPRGKCRNVNGCYQGPVAIPPWLTSRTRDCHLHPSAHVINTLLSSLCALPTLSHLMKTLRNSMGTAKYGSVIWGERKMTELALWHDWNYVALPSSCQSTEACSDTLGKSHGFIGWPRQHWNKAPLGLAYATVINSIN